MTFPPPLSMGTGMAHPLAENQSIQYELHKDERRGKTSAVDLKVL
jgi:hypothetical protein